MMKMTTSLRRSMSLLFLAFLLLVSVSVAVTAWAIDSQKQDALIINLAGRQRMLIQRMTKDALQLEQSQDERSDLSQDLQEAAGLFDQTLGALINGGLAPYLPGRLVQLPTTPNLDIQLGLQEVDHTWGIFRGYLEIIRTAKPNSPDFTRAVQGIRTLSANLVQQADSVVRLYEAASARAVARLRWIQAIFLVAALGLLAAGFWVTQKSVVKPLSTLGAMAERMGGGDLYSPVTVNGPAEIRLLAHSLETMRSQLQRLQMDLESQVAQRTHELTATFELSREIVADLQLDRLLPSVTERARSLIGAPAAALCLLEPDGQFLRLAASSGNVTNRAGLKQAVESEPIVKIIGEGRTVTAAAGCFNCRVWQVYGSGQGLAAPLRAGEQTLGALCVLKPGSSDFDPDETRAFTLLANSAAIAIANAHLVESGRRQAEQAAALAEREALAAELHDHLAQTLSFLNLQTDRLGELLVAGHTAAARTELEKLKSAVTGAYAQVRIALATLREPTVITGGLAADGQALAEKLATSLADFRQTTHLPADLIIADPAALAVPPAIQKQILYIVREVLTNIRRHAQAQHVWLRVEQVEGETRFTVEDDGCGFDPASSGGDNHLGLTIIRARAERSGGQLVIDSAPGAGTRVSVYFPRKELG
jgi:two-component system nitrate/nitrite sensor histidine kinase NarX